MANPYKEKRPTNWFIWIIIVGGMLFFGAMLLTVLKFAGVF